MFGFVSLIIFFDKKKKNEAEPNIGVMIAYDSVHSNTKGSAAGKWENGTKAADQSKKHEGSVDL